MRKVIEENIWVFTELFSAKPPHVFGKRSPIGIEKVVSIHDLAPCLSAAKLCTGRL